MPEGKKFYGAVTVSERGQIVIPAEARRDFNINTGDKLLVLGDLEQGIAFTTMEILSRNMAGTMELFREMNGVAQAESETDEEQTTR